MTILGENKTVAEWSRDSRCGITYTTLMLRVRSGWQHDPQILKPKDGSSPFSGRFVAYTESGKCVGQFLTIERAETAIMETSRKGEVVDRIIPRLIPIPRQTAPANPSREEKLVTAWGETKNLYAWSRDPRCAVCLETLYARFRTKKKSWMPEAAISTPSNNCFVGETKRGTGALYRGFGEAKDLYQWARDPRCEIGRQTLKKRLLSGIPVEEAVGRGGLKPRVQAERVSGLRFTAFNQTKPFSEWVRDPRCQVGASTLRLHIQMGLPMAQALLRSKSGPPKDPDKSKRPPPLPRSKLGVMLTLFGETKSAVAWAKDSRSEITYHQIVARIRAGFDRSDPKILLPSPRFSAFRNRFQAFDARSKELGRFPTLEKATAAIEASSKTGVVVDVTTKREFPVPREIKSPKRVVMTEAIRDSTGPEGSETPGAPKRSPGRSKVEVVPMPRPGVAIGYERSDK